MYKPTDKYYERLKQIPKEKLQADIIDTCHYIEDEGCRLDDCLAAIQREALKTNPDLYMMKGLILTYYDKNGRLFKKHRHIKSHIDNIRGMIDKLLLKKERDC